MALFGACPFRRFTIFFHWRPDLDYGGGLEHPDSVTMNVGSKWMQDLPVEAAGTIAHELLHTWNGEAFRPTCMANWDYRRENPCALLWFVEGVSSYYATVILARAGILSQDEFLRWISRAVSCHEDQPLRASESLEEAAVAEWVRPVENLDYYCGGEVVGFLLDTTIRVRTGGVRSLDDVMRALYGASRRRGYRGYGDADLVRTIRAASGLDLGPVLVKWTKEAAEIDYGAVLAGSGLELAVEGGERGKTHFTLRRVDAAAAGVIRILDAITEGTPPPHDGAKLH